MNKNPGSVCYTLCGEITGELLAIFHESGNRYASFKQKVHQVVSAYILYFVILL